jgi:hypothetical protein
LLVGKKAGNRYYRPLYVRRRRREACHGLAGRLLNGIYIIDIQITISQLLFPSFFFFPPLFHIFRRLSLPIPDEWDVLPSKQLHRIFRSQKKLWR